jgi:hypothetical protein
VPPQEFVLVHHEQDATLGLMLTNPLVVARGDVAVFLAAM